jgi:hypothetical protein
MLPTKRKHEDENTGFETEWDNGFYLWREIKYFAFKTERY